MPRVAVLGHPLPFFLNIEKVDLFMESHLKSLKQSFCEGTDSKTMDDRRGFKFAVHHTGQCLKWTSGARVMACPRYWVGIYSNRSTCA